MKKNTLTLLLLFVPILLLAQDKNSKKLISKVPDQDIINWTEEEFEKQVVIKLDEIGVFMPYFLSVNDEGDIALLDWSQRTVFLIRNNEYGEIEKIGGKKGRGPGEYETPFDILLTNDKKIYISDIESRKIDIWNTDKKKLEHSFKLEERFVKPDKIVICNEDSTKMLYVLSTQYGYGYNDQSGILHKYIVNENSIQIQNTFQELEDDDERYPYVITGQIACDIDKSFFYSGDFTGTIRRYDSNGELNFVRNAASNKIEEPLFIKNRKDHTKFNPKAPRVNGEIFINGQYLIVGHSRKKDRYIYGLDYYSKLTGKYIKTIKLPVPAKEIAIKNEKLYLIEYRNKEGFNLNIYNFYTE